MYSNPVDIILDSGCVGPCDGSDYVKPVPVEQKFKELPDEVTINGQLTSRVHKFEAIDEDDWVLNGKYTVTTD